MELKFIESPDGQPGSTIDATQVKAVVVMNGKTLFVKKRSHSTLELPSIKPENGEKPSAALNRLLEKNLNTTGVSVKFVCAYSTTDGQEEFNGALYLVEVSSMRTLNDHELCASYFLDKPPEDREKWTFPETDIPLLNKAMELLNTK